MLQEEHKLRVVERERERERERGASLNVCLDPQPPYAVGFAIGVKAAEA